MGLLKGSLMVGLSLWTNRRLRKGRGGAQLGTLVGPAGTVSPPLLPCYQAPCNYRISPLLPFDSLP